MRLAERLVGLGVEPGDRVALFLPMSPEVAIASHACAHVGAVQVPIFSGFAAPAVAQRLQDSGAKVAITARTSLRRGREVPMLAILEEARRESPAVEHVIVAPWEDELTGCPGTLEPLAVDSEHPYLLTYTSGTTGKPKGVLHVQGGFLVSIAREAAYQADARADDVIHFATDMGWIMGPWTLVGFGAAGATIVFAEGAPDWPPDRLWRLVEEERVTRPRLLADPHPRSHPPRRSGRGSLVPARDRHHGEPWNPAPYRWLFERVGGKPLSDHQLLGRDRGRGLLSLVHARRADQGVLPRCPGAGDGDGRARPGRTLARSAPARSASWSAGSPSQG